MTQKNVSMTVPSGGLKKKRHYIGTLSEEQINQSLFRFFEEAAEIYQDEVVENGKDYDRFVADFIDLRFEIDGDYLQRNAHRRNRNVVLSVLTIRKDLAMPFVFGGGFCMGKFAEMMHEFDSRTKKQKSSSPYNTPNASILVRDGVLDTKQIALITKVAKENNLFLVDDLTEEHMRQLLSCKPDFQIKAGYLCGISLLFDRLSWNGLIHHRWQSILGRGRFILSGNSDKPICANTFSTSLSKSRNSASMEAVKLKKALDEYFPKHTAGETNMAVKKQ